MKKVLSLLLCSAFIFAAGCGESAPPDGGDEPGTEQTEKLKYFEDDDIIEVVNAEDVRELTDIEYTLENTVAIDIYGRKVLTYGNAKEGRDVGMFYFSWLGHLPDAEIYDISELLLNRPDNLWNPEGTKYSPVAVDYFWTEPLYGYYNSCDPWVLERQVQIFITLGIDFLGFDATNTVFYQDAYVALFKVLEKYHEQGYKVPKVMFLLNAQSATRLRSVYEDYYKPEANIYELPEYLRYAPNGKPLVSADLGELEAAGAAVEDLTSYFEVKHTWWPNEPAENYPNSFSWMDWGWPQTNFEDGYINVSVAQHVSGRFSNRDAGNWGRGYNHKTNRNERSGIRTGTNYQSQWGSVFDLLEKDSSAVSNVFITGYNEWVAGKWVDNGAAYFVDQFNEEYSRDIEPMKGGYADNYLLQTAANVRRFKYEKGKSYQLPQHTVTTLTDLAAWEGAKKYVAFTDNVFDRNFCGWNKNKIYTDTTGRNDIADMLITHDAENLYVAVSTVDKISDYTEGDKNWMNLWLGANSDGTFDFVVNRTPGSGKTSIEKRTASGWENVGEADYAVSGNRIFYRIPLSVIGANPARPAVTIKASDNVDGAADVMNFYVHGDCAPIGRFAYSYGV